METPDPRVPVIAAEFLVRDMPRKYDARIRPGKRRVKGSIGIQEALSLANDDQVVRNPVLNPTESRDRREQVFMFLQIAHRQEIRP